MLHIRVCKFIYMLSVILTCTKSEKSARESGLNVMVKVQYMPGAIKLSSPGKSPTQTINYIQHKLQVSCLDSSKYETKQ